MTRCIAAAVALITPCAAFAQDSVMVPYGGGNPTPVAQAPADTGDSPEDIAKDAARDLKDSRFYNKPGATRAQYDADWQRCRLIARGSRTPAGMVPYYYNPAVISPLAAGIGGGLGGLLGAAIAEGQRRRANRRACLLINGWRMVEVPNAEQARVAAMTDADRSAYFDTIVGARDVKGEVTERTSFSLAPDPALALDAPVAGSPTVFTGKKTDPKAPILLGPDEGLVVVAFRRPDAGSAGRTGQFMMARYDVTARDRVYQPRDWKKKGDKTTYAMTAKSADKKAPYEVQVLRLTAGDYVVDSSATGSLVPATTNCFGAPTFHVGAGETVYLGDFIPYWNVKTANGAVSTLAWAPHLEEARTALAAAQPTMASAMKAATWRNRATYASAGLTMDRFDLPGVEALPEPALQGTTTAAATS